MNTENSVFLNNRHFGKYILLTLSRADATELRASVDKATIVEIAEVRNSPIVLP